MNTSLAIKDKSIIEQIKNCYKRDNRNKNLKNRIDISTVFVCFKNICNSLGLKGFSVNSWRKTLVYWYYEKYKNLYFLQWYFGHNSAKQTMDFIGVTESISNKFQQGVCL